MTPDLLSTIRLLRDSAEEPDVALVWRVRGDDVDLAGAVFHGDRCQISATAAAADEQHAFVLEQLLVVAHLRAVDDQTIELITCRVDFWELREPKCTGCYSDVVKFFLDAFLREKLGIACCYQPVSANFVHTLHLNVEFDVAAKFEPLGEQLQIVRETWYK